MSAYGDSKAGLITDYEYNSICRREAMEDDERDYREPCEWDLFDDDELMGEVFKEDDIEEF